MKIAICTIVAATAVNAQLAIPNRLRATNNEWGRRRTQITRSLESSMSFSMPEVDASMPELDVHALEESSMSMSEMSMVGSMVGDMTWAVPDEPEIILDEVPVVESEEEIILDENEEQEEFVDGEFMDMKLE